LNRIEEYPFPEAALREALLNAIAHKDCSHGSPPPMLRYEHGGFWVDFSGETPGMILSALQDDSGLSIPEIANRIGRSERAVERAIRKLRETGNLEHIGPAKGGYWRVLEK